VGERLTAVSDLCTLCVCVPGSMQIGRLNMHRLPYGAAWRELFPRFPPGEKSASDVLSLFDVWVHSLSQVTAFTCLHICSIYSIKYVRVGGVFNVACAWTVSPVLVQRIVPHVRLSYINISVTCAVYA
jgi:hypothetical protein